MNTEEEDFEIAAEPHSRHNRGKVKGFLQKAWEKMSGSVISEEAEYPEFEDSMASSSLSNKLNTMREVLGPGRVALSDLTDPAGYAISEARTHVHATFGPSVILTVIYKGEEAICFLPKRHALSLSPAEVIALGSGSYRIRCMGIKNKSPIVDIYEST